MKLNTKDKILQTAARCIATQGIERTTTRRIAEMAGVSRGLVPYYIPKRKDLLFEVINYIFRTVQSKARKNIADLTGVDFLLVALRTNFEEFLGKPHYYACFLLSYYYAHFNKKFLKLHTEQYRHNRTRFIQLLEVEAQKKGKTFSPESLALKAEEVLDLLDGGLLFYSAVEHELTLLEYTDRRMKIIENNLNLFLAT